MVIAERGALRSVSATRRAPRHVPQRRRRSDGRKRFLAAAPSRKRGASDCHVAAVVVVRPGKRCAICRTPAANLPAVRTRRCCGLAVHAPCLSSDMDIWGVGKGGEGRPRCPLCHGRLGRDVADAARRLVAVRVERGITSARLAAAAAALAEEGPSSSSEKIEKPTSWLPLSQIEQWTSWQQRPLFSPPPVDRMELDLTVLLPSLYSPVSEEPGECGGDAAPPSPEPPPSFESSPVVRPPPPVPSPAADSSSPRRPPGEAARGRGVAPSTPRRGSTTVEEPPFAPLSPTSPLPPPHRHAEEERSPDYIDLVSPPPRDLWRQEPLPTCEYLLPPSPLVQEECCEMVIGANRDITDAHRYWHDQRNACQFCERIIASGVTNVQHLRWHVSSLNSAASVRAAAAKGACEMCFCHHRVARGS